jgi:serine/threonine protein phosphatase 1
MTISSRQLSLPKSLLRRPPRAARGERVYAIGDVHGRADLLSELLDGIAEDRFARPATGLRVRLLILGDFIDRGPASATVLRALQMASKSDNVTVLLGNHEQALLDCAAGWQDPREGWLRVGGDATLRSLAVPEPQDAESVTDFALRLRSAIGKETLSWLQKLALSTTSGDFYFCHAGVKPGRDLSDQDKHDLLWIRDEFLRSRLYQANPAWQFCTLRLENPLSLELQP